MIKTKFVNDISPFTGKHVNLDTLEVCADKLPKMRVFKSKYDAVFSSLERGGCVKCQTADVGPVQLALRAWLKRHSKHGKTTSVTNYPGTKPGEPAGRVWWL